MIRQKSFENDNPTLYLVPTPIGNLSEMTPRAIEILKSVDIIACEDTRTSKPLLLNFDIHTKTIAYHNFNEKESAKGIVQLLEDGLNVALISDAGYPLISDPGVVLVKEVSEKGFNVVPLSGCNAALNALVASGLMSQPFMFVGFLPQSNNDREKKLQELSKVPCTMIFYEAPHRIEKMLNSCLNILGDRNACLARELTKRHEEFIRGTLSELVTLEDLKGEMVVIIDGYVEEEREYTSDDILSFVFKKVNSGLSRKDAIKETAKELNLNKSKVYDIVNKSDC